MSIPALRGGTMRPRIHADVKNWMGDRMVQVLGSYHLSIKSFDNHFFRYVRYFWFFEKSKSWILDRSEFNKLKKILRRLPKMSATCRYQLYIVILRFYDFRLSAKKSDLDHQFSVSFFVNVVQSFLSLSIHAARSRRDLRTSFWNTERCFQK